MGDSSIESRVLTLEREMGEMRKTLFIGNGHPPLIERFAALERSQATQIWLLRTIVGGVLTNIVGLAFVAAKMVLK